MILFQMIYKPCQKWTWPKTLLWQSWYLSTNMPARSNSREIVYLSSFAKPNSKNQKVNGQFESLLFTFEPLECDNKEDLCYWNLEFIDRNQSIIVLVFFPLLARQGKKWDCDSFVWSESSSGYGIAYRHFNSNIISFKMHLQSLFLSFKPQKPKEN